MSEQEAATRIRWLAEQVLNPDSLVQGGEAEELARGALELLALVGAQREELERLRAEYERDRTVWIEEIQAGHEAERERDEARAERDEWLSAAAQYRRPVLDLLDEARAETQRLANELSKANDVAIFVVPALEAERDRVREALQQLIASVVEYVGDDQTAAAQFYPAVTVARAALVGSEGGEE